MRNPKILLVFPGLGKTYTAKKDPRVVEVQVSLFRNLFLKNAEKISDHFKYRRIIQFSPNPEYPKNLLKHVNKIIKSGQIIVMALKAENFKFCVDNNFPYAFVLPSGSKLVEVNRAYVLKGNKKDHVEEVLAQRYAEAQEIIKRSDAYTHTVNKGEFLENVLTRYIF